MTDILVFHFNKKFLPKQFAFAFIIGFEVGLELIFILEDVEDLSWVMNPQEIPLERSQDEQGDLVDNYPPVSEEHTEELVYLWKGYGLCKESDYPWSRKQFHCDLKMREVHVQVWQFVLDYRVYYFEVLLHSF